MSYTNTQSLEKLLEIEQLGQDKINHENENRKKRMDKAKLEVQEQLKSYKSDKQNQLDELQKTYNKEDLQKISQDKTEQEIEKIKKQYEQNKAAVVKLLSENILNVDLKIPKVQKGF